MASTQANLKLTQVQGVTVVSEDGSTPAAQTIRLANELKKSTERFEQITPSIVYIYWNSSSSVLIPSNKKDGSIFNS